jgi:hypothetical protein
MPIINEFWMRVIYRSCTPLTQLLHPGVPGLNVDFGRGENSFHTVPLMGVKLNTQQNEMKRKPNPTSKQYVIGRLLPWNEHIILPNCAFTKLVWIFVEKDLKPQKWKEKACKTWLKKKRKRPCQNHIGKREITVPCLASVYNWVWITDTFNFQLPY